jgi:Tfp pilus assembly protein PilF
MVCGGAQKPEGTTEARPHGPCCGRRAGTGPGLPRSARRRSSGVYRLGGLAVLALWGAWSLAMVGCSIPGSDYARIAKSPGSLLANMRQSPEEISRLKRNAHYYNLMGQPELGLKEVELAHQQNPDNLQITDLLAQTYEELGKFEAARQLYQEALTRQGPNAVLANNLCFSYYHEGRWQEAETCFRQTLSHNPGNVAARNNLGLLYCRLGRQDEAHRLWQEAEGVAAADTKMNQALAVLGVPESAVYAARKPDPTPPVARATQAPTPKAAASRLSAAIPAKPDTPAHPVTSQVPAGQLAAKPPAPKPVPVEAGPQPEARKQAAVAPKALADATAAPAPQVTGRTSQAPLTAADTLVATKTETEQPAARRQEPLGADRAKAGPGQPPSAPKSEASAPMSLTSPAPLTAVELVDTAIEVRNGTWTKDLARQTRSRLCQEGFTVAMIGNHVDFGAAKTIIYYRPEAERVALTVGRTVFPQAALEPSQKLKEGMDIKILLGADLLERPQLMARLAAGDS